MALSAAAAWNQNEPDWRLMLEIGHGWGISLADGTLASSGPPTLSGDVGTVQWRSERRICSLASPCQMTLAWPVSISIGSPFLTQLAMSSSTP